MNSTNNKDNSFPTQEANQSQKDTNLNTEKETLKRKESTNYKKYMDIDNNINKNKYTIHYHLVFDSIFGYIFFK